MTDVVGIATMSGASAEELVEYLDGLGWTARHREEASAAIALSQERADEDLEFAVRMQLTANGVMTDTTDVALTHFAWCAAKHQEDPARFYGDEDSESDQIFWHYKWMPGIFAASPVFDLSQLDEVLEDFEQTYRRAGLGLHAVAIARMEAAVNTGRVAEAERWAAEVDRMPRDDFSSCEACIPADFVDFELLRGNEAGAVDRAVESWRADNSCAEEPESMLATVLVPMLRLGRLEEAKEAYDIAYGYSRNHDDKVRNVSHCALFASLSGNHELALSLVERHLAWLGHDALRESDHFVALVNFATVLDRLIAVRGAADVVVRGSAAPALAALLPAAERPRTAGELAEALWEAAEGLGVRFDARNGNGLHAQRIAQARALVSESHSLELEPPAGFTPITVRAAEPGTAREWLDRSVDATWLGLPADAIFAAEQALERGAELTAHERLRAVAQINGAAAQVQDEDRVQRSQEAYVAWVEEAYGPDSGALAAMAVTGASSSTLLAGVDAHPGAATLVTVRAYQLAVGDLLMKEEGPSTEDLEAADAALARAEEAVLAALATQAPADVTHDHALLLASGRHSRAQVRMMLGDADGAFAQLDQVEADGLSRPVRAAILELRGRLLRSVDNPDEAAEAMDQAASLLAASGWEHQALLRALDAANAWVHAGEADEAVARFDFALSLLAPDVDPPVGLRWDYAQALLGADEADRAVPYFERILRDELVAGDVDPGSVAQSHLALGRAYDAAYDDRAATHYLDAARLFMQAEAPDAAADAAYLAGRELQYQERSAQAVEALELARSQNVLAPQPTREVAILLQLAQAQSASDQPGWENHAREAVALVRQVGDADQLARAIGTEVGLYHHREDYARVVELAGPATDELLALGDLQGAVGMLWWLGQAEEKVGGADAASATLHRYLQRRGEFGDAQGSLKEMGGELLRGWKRKDEATRWQAAF